MMGYLFSEGSQLALKLAFFFFGSFQLSGPKVLKGFPLVFIVFFFYP